MTSRIMSSPTSIIDPYVHNPPAAEPLHKVTSNDSAMTATTASASAYVSATSSSHTLDRSVHTLDRMDGMVEETSMMEPTSSDSDADAVQVVVRIRPLLPLEAGNEETLHVVASNNDGHQVLTPASSTSDDEFPSLHQNLSNDSQFSYQSIQVGKQESSPSFTFDHVFPSPTTQSEVYHTSVSPLVQSCLEGYHATVLAYGQTGSGKTHSMLGGVEDRDAGVIPRGLRHVFEGLQQRQQEILSQESSSSVPSSPMGGDSNPLSKPPGSPRQKVVPYEYSVRIQFIELYGEEIRDLLPPETDPSSPRAAAPTLRKSASVSEPYLQRRRSGGPEYKVVANPHPRPKSASNTDRKNIILRDGKAGGDTEVLGVEKQLVTSPEEALQKLRDGMTQRVVGRTAMNATSSRSHAIFTIIVQQTVRRQPQAGRKCPPEMKTSKIHFVDLSGSESIKRSKTVGKRQKEGIDINKGLLVLGNVISALAHPKKRNGHVPYRDSKLTRLLKGSLGGNHKTLMIACVSPSASNTAESINTLRYANRAKAIQNHAKVNVDPASRVVNELRLQVAALARELLRVQNYESPGLEGETRDGQNEDREIDDFVFSKDFLHSLVEGANAPPLWRKKKTTRMKPPESLYQPRQSLHYQNDHSRNSKETLKQEDSPQHHSLESIPSSDSVDMLRKEMNAQIEESDAQSVYTADTGVDTTATSDQSKLDKNIISYDFALSALRNRIEAKAGNKEIDTEESELGLKTVRNIDELYKYLNEDSDVVIDNDESDEEETVYSNRVSKLNDTIAENELLLRDMMNCHSKYESLRQRNASELQRIEAKIRQYNQEKSALENLMEVFDDSSQFSGEMSKSLDGKEHLLASLKERQQELFTIQHLSDENERDIENLSNELSVLHRQKRALNLKMNKFSEESEENHADSVVLNDSFHSIGSLGTLSSTSQSLANPNRSRATVKREKRKRKGVSRHMDLPSIEEEESRIQALDEQINKLKEEKAAAQERLRANIPQYFDLDVSNHTSSISATSSTARSRKDYKWDGQSHERPMIIREEHSSQLLNDEELRRVSSSESGVKSTSDDGSQSFKRASVRRSKHRTFVLNPSGSKVNGNTKLSSANHSGRINPHFSTLSHNDANLRPRLIADDTQEPMIENNSDNVVCESLKGVADFFRIVLGIKKPQSAVSWQW